MNSRQFAAAHDRLLEPPEEEFDDTTDEMDLADIERQAQIDREDWLAEQYRQKQEDNQ